MIYYWKFWEPWADAMLVVLLPKLWFWIGNHDWHNCFWMSLWLFVGWTLTEPKKASKSTIFFTVIDWIRKKLLVDVANLAPCCHDDYDVLLEVLGTLGKCYVSNPVAKTLVWIENHDWHNCFCMSSWGSPLLDPKKLQNEQFYIIDWIRKKLLVDVANLAPCCLLLLAAPCCCLLLLTCCLPAAAHLLLTPTRCIGITTPGRYTGETKN